MRFLIRNLDNSKHVDAKKVSETLVPQSNENMRVDERKFVCEFSQLSRSGQTRTRVALELISESLYESFLGSRVLVRRAQELRES